MEENPDANFNYDILTVGVSDGAIHRLTHQVGPQVRRRLVAGWVEDRLHPHRPSDHLDGNDGGGRPPLHHER